MLSETEKAYIAGFLDGEGCFAIYKNRGSFQSVLQVGNTNLEILQWLQSVYGGTLTTLKIRSVNHRQAYMWKVVSNDCMKVILDLSPYLREKKAQTDIIVLFQSKPKTTGLKFAEKVKELKSV